MSRNIGLVAALALMPVIGVVILPLCAVAVGMSAACCGDRCGFKNLLANGAFLMLCAVGGFGSCRVNDPLAGAVSRNIGLVAALALVPVVGAVILPLCTVAVGMSAACCGDLHQELDGAVGIFLCQVHDLAVYIQLHIVGEGHALLRLQIDSGRILLTGDKRCGCVAPKYKGLFNLIRIAAGHGDTIDRRYLSGHRCDLHRRLRHIVGACGGGNCGELYLELDGAVGGIFRQQVHDLAVYIQLHIVGEGHALLRLQNNDGRIFLAGHKRRVAAQHAGPPHRGLFDLILIVAEHRDVHGALGLLSGHRRCDLHRRLRHIVGACGGVNCGEHYLELDRAVGGIFRQQVHDLAVYIQLHIVGEGHALLRLQNNDGRIFLAGHKRRVAAQHAGPPHRGLFDLILIVAEHRDVHGALGLLSGYRRCDLHRRLRHIVGVCGGVFGEVHIDNYVVVVDDVDTLNCTVGNGDVLLLKAIFKGIAALGIQRIPHAVGGVCIITSCVECPIFIDIRRCYAHALGGDGRGYKIGQSLALLPGLDGQADGIDLGRRITAGREGHTDDHVALVDALNLPHLAVGQGDAAGIKAICKDSARFSDELEGYAVGLVPVIGRLNVFQLFGVGIRICPVVVADVIQL